MSDVTPIPTDESAFHGVDFKMPWCEGYGMPCNEAGDCCGNRREMRAVSYQHALDVEATLRAEVETWKRIGMQRNRMIVDLREALIQMDEAICHNNPETAKRIAREAYS